MTARGENNSTLARKLAGPGADPKKVASERRQIIAWLGGRRLEEPTARRVAKALRIPWRELYEEPPTRRTVERRLAALEDLVALNARNLEALTALVEEHEAALKLPRRGRGRPS
jgi:hypothetical protein